MIVDANAKELTSLYVLDLLDDDERAEFESQLESFPELGDYVAEVRDVVGAVALTAPPHQADPETLEKIQRRVIPPSKIARLADAGSRLLALRGGWPVAAALALFLGWQVTDRVITRSSAANHHAEPSQPGDESGTTISPSTRADGSSSAGTAATDEEKHLWSILRKAGAKDAYELIQDFEGMKKELAHLTKINDARYNPVPGRSPMVIIEMHDPNAQDLETAEPVLPSEAVNDIVAAGIIEATKEETTPAEESDGTLGSTSGVSFTGDDSSSEGQLRISSGMPPLGLLNLPPGESILHLDLPIHDAARYNLTTDGNGNYYDGNNHIIWRRTANGSAHIGMRPTQPIRESDFPFVPDPPKPTEPTAVTEVDAVQTPENSVGREEAAVAQRAPSRAWTFFNESDGSASIIVQNLPELAEETAFQLWFPHPESEEPVNAGLLPPDLMDGFGRVDFELPKGFSPERFFLTIEPINGLHGSKTPTGATILEGP